MGTIHQLFYANGGSPEVITCAYCGASLHDERSRAVTSTPGGTKFFCKSEPDMKPEETCYLSWRLLRH